MNIQMHGVKNGGDLGICKAFGVSACTSTLTGLGKNPWQNTMGMGAVDNVYWLVLVNDWRGRFL